MLYTVEIVNAADNVTGCTVKAKSRREAINRTMKAQHAGARFCWVEGCPFDTPARPLSTVWKTTAGEYIRAHAWVAADLI